MAGVQATYTYDPLGRRTTKVVTGPNYPGTTYFLDSGDDEIAEYWLDSGNNPYVARRFVPGPGIDQPIAMIDCTGATRPNCTGSGAVKTFFHQDKTGSVIAMSNADGSLAEGPYAYDPYGNGALTGVPYKYTGRRLDPETNLYYYRARYYSASIGRFLQTDPVGYKDDIDWYAYVGNDPTDKTDPSGMNACGTNNDSTCPVVITVRSRSKDMDGNYNDQYTGAKNQANYNATATIAANGQTAGTVLIRTTPSSGGVGGTIKNGVYEGMRARSSFIRATTRR